MESMEVFTVEEYSERFDELTKRVEEGETIGIVTEDGKAAVLVPAEQYNDAIDLIRIHTEDNNDAQ